MTSDDLEAKSAAPRGGNEWAMASFCAGVTSACCMVLLLLTDSPDVGRPVTGLCLLSILAGLLLGCLGYLRSSVYGGKKMAMLGLALGGISLLVGLIFPVLNRMEKRASMVISIGNCRQIEIALMAYASDHDGKYPDAAFEHPLNSNEVFRKLFIEGYLTDERIFGCEVSPYQPDGVIGQAPDFREAVKAGENHWAMTRGQMSTAQNGTPLVFENPVEATWPPRWNAEAVEVPKPGRVWWGRKVIIGLNDGSAIVGRLNSRWGTSVELAPKGDGLPIFPKLSPPPEILNVEK